MLTMRRTYLWDCRPFAEALYSVSQLRISKDISAPISHSCEKLVFHLVLMIAVARIGKMMTGGSDTCSGYPEVKRSRTVHFLALCQGLNSLQGVRGAYCRRLGFCMPCYWIHTEAHQDRPVECHILSILSRKATSRTRGMVCKKRPKLRP